jgi:hypothetical protein
MDADTGHGRSRLRRQAVLAAAIAGTAVALTACGGSAPVGGSAAYRKAVAYTGCMRSHGEAAFPDPTSTGNFSLGQIDVESAQYQSASSACQNLLPHSAQFQVSAAEQQAILARALKFAQCMRTHGLQNFPDPSGHIIVHNGGVGVGIAGSGLPQGQLQAELDTPQGQAAWKACMAIIASKGNRS